MPAWVTISLLPANFNVIRHSSSAPSGLKVAVSPSIVATLFRKIELYEARRLQRKRKGERKSSQIFVEPRDGLLQSAGLVLRFDEEMAFARINNELCRHAERFQRVPEFVRLRRGTFRVTLTDNNQCRRLHVLDEANGRTL